MNQMPITNAAVTTRCGSAKVPACLATNGFDVRSLVLAEANSPDSDQQRALERIRPSVDYILQHLDQPMNVGDLSTLVGLAESSFFALFKRATGRAPIEFVIRMRMGIAGEMLRSSELHIKQIAASLGYPDQFYFSRLFKSVHGVSPTDYRSGAGDSSDCNRAVLDPAVCAASALVVEEVRQERNNVDYNRRVAPPANPAFATAVPGNGSRLHSRP